MSSTEKPLNALACSNIVLVINKSYSHSQVRVRMKSVTKRAYGQFCGLARAVELLGERWALLVVRDLLVSPKRFTDLRRALPRIPTNVLSDRLRELEDAGVVHRRVLPRPAGSIVYELTEYGEQLEDIVLR